MGLILEGSKLPCGLRLFTMFAFLIWGVILAVALGIIYAYSMSRDVFHPLIFIGPMMLFMYAWMPMKLDAIGGLDGFFQRDQLDFVQSINFLGVTSFVLGCLTVSLKFDREPVPRKEISPGVMVICGAVVGLMGLGAWIILLSNAGGFAAAFGEQSASVARTGGWDDNGYIRDSALLMFPAFLLILTATFKTGFRFLNSVLLLLFIIPWVLQAVLTARRGPTFMIAVILAMGWFLNKKKRPSIILAAASGVTLGFLMLFLVINRNNIYLGSDNEMKTDVSTMVEKPDTGN
jgi:oligosaccharide repeat unit polymerase